MPLRSSMAALVGRLRQMTFAATDDEFGGETFWSDEQLQEVLDRAGRTFVRGAKLTARSYKLAGETQYNEQFFSVKPQSAVIEENAVVRDSDGNEIEDVTIDYGLKVVIFGTNPSSSSQYYIDLYLYDLNAAAAEVWETKAAHRFDWVNMRGGNHKFDFNQTPEFCVARSKHYRQRIIKSWTRT